MVFESQQPKQDINYPLTITLYHRLLNQIKVPGVLGVLTVDC